MIKVKMKKFALIILRKDLEEILNELLLLGCAEPAERGDLLADAELAALGGPEDIELSKYRANKERITLFGTEYTILLTGWVPASSENELLANLSKYMIAWDFQYPSPDEYGKAPVQLKMPKISRIFYRGAGKPFTPLSIV